MYEEIKNYLTTEPKSRERRNRSRAIVNLLLNQFPELKEIPKDKLCDFIHLADSYDRIFRKVLEENPNLQGSDYQDKKILEEQKILELGYSPNFRQNMLKLSNL